MKKLIREGLAALALFALAATNAHAGAIRTIAASSANSAAALDNLPAPSAIPVRYNDNRAPITRRIWRACAPATARAQTKRSPERPLAYAAIFSFGFLDTTPPCRGRNATVRSSLGDRGAN